MALKVAFIRNASLKRLYDRMRTNERLLVIICVEIKVVRDDGQFMKTAAFLAAAHKRQRIACSSYYHIG